MSGPVEVPVPQARIIYEGKDISADISPYLLSVGYTDRLSGESDELELRLEDTDGRWRGDWYPGKGDSLTVSIGYAGQEPVSCGSFEIDEIDFPFHRTRFPSGRWPQASAFRAGRGKARGTRKLRWPEWSAWCADGWG